MRISGKPDLGTRYLCVLPSPHILILRALLVRHSSGNFNRNLSSTSSCFYGSRAAVAAATFQRHCRTTGDRNNPSSRHNGDISDGSTRDLDGGNFPRWALVPCAGRGTFRRFRSVWGRRDGHFSGRYWRGSCISWRGARKGVKALHTVPCVGRIWEYEQYGRAEMLD